MAEKKYEFHYRAADVASAQRMRMLHSKQTRVLAVVWLVSSLALAAPAIFPRAFPGGPMASGTLVLQVALIYLVTMAVMIFVTPYFDFAFRRFWRLPLQYQFNEKQMRLSVVKGKSKGLRLEWREIERVEENARVYILYYGTGGKFMILPKHAFDERGLERFEALVQRVSSRPAPPAVPAKKVETAGAVDTVPGNAGEDPFEDDTEGVEGAEAKIEAPVEGAAGAVVEAGAEAEGEPPARKGRSRRKR